jgi:hypothetical protein
MRRFMLLHYGFETPTPEIQDAWGRWFASVAEKMVDSGSPFSSGREISPTSTKDLPLGMESLTGYTIIGARNMDEAEEIARGCPMIKFVRLYEMAA